LHRASCDIHPAIIGEYGCAHEGSVGRGKHAPNVYSSLEVRLACEERSPLCRTGLDSPRGNTTAPVGQRSDAHQINGGVSCLHSGLQAGNAVARDDQRLACAGMKLVTEPLPCTLPADGQGWAPSVSSQEGRVRLSKGVTTGDVHGPVAGAGRVGSSARSSDHCRR